MARRVSQGGHSIPEDVIRRRYPASIRNTRDFYLPVADEAETYDNSDMGRVLIAEKTRGAYLYDSRSRAVVANRGGSGMNRRSSQEIHEAIRKGLDKASRSIASGEDDGSGRFYTDEELAAGAATGRITKAKKKKEAPAA